MRKLLMFSVVTLVAAASTGCNTCGNSCCSSPCRLLSMRGMFSRQQCCPQVATQYCAPAASPCCDSCGGGGGSIVSGDPMMGSMSSGAMMMPSSPGCNCQN